MFARKSSRSTPRRWQRPSRSHPGAGHGHPAAARRRGRALGRDRQLGVRGARASRRSARTRCSASSCPSATRPMTRSGWARCWPSSSGIEAVVEDIAPRSTALGCYARQDEAIRDGRSRSTATGWKCKITLPVDPRERAAQRLPADRAVARRASSRRARMPLGAYLQIVAATNFKQRVRKMIEYYHADRLNYAVVGTPNRLEYDQGFFVKQGDGAADFKPIAHLYKTQVYALADDLGVPGGDLPRGRRPPTRTRCRRRRRSSTSRSPTTAWTCACRRVNHGVCRRGRRAGRGPHRRAGRARVQGHPVEAAGHPVRPPAAGVDRTPLQRDGDPVNFAPARAPLRGDAAAARLPRAQPPRGWPTRWRSSARASASPTPSSTARQRARARAGRSAASSAAIAWWCSPTTPSRRWSSFWAVLKANAVVVDRQPADQGRQARRTYLNDCRATALITDDAPEARWSARRPVGAPRRGHLRQPSMRSRADADAAGSRRCGRARRSRRRARNIDIDLAAIIYTSGSHRRSEGRDAHPPQHAHRGDVDLAPTSRCVEDDVILGVLPLAFDYGLYQMIMAFRVGRAAGARALVRLPGAGAAR